MSLLKFAAAALLAVLPAAAQAPLPTLRIEPAAGGSIFYVRNTYSQPLTGYLIELVDYPGSSFSYWQDVPDAEPVAPGAEIRKSISNMTVGAVPDYVKLQAAIFADGATAGVPGKVTQLVERRRATFAAVRELISRFEKTQSKDALLADLKNWSDSLPQLSKVAARSQAGINQDATRLMIRKTAARLEAEQPGKLLADLKTLERAMAATRPTL
jgi:hypothetical protein